MFFRSSRYEKVDDYKFKRSDGSEVSLKQKRKIPEPVSKMLHVVQEGDRTDLLAFHYYDDPLKFWKLADANEEMNPENLMNKPGEKIIVPPNDSEK